MSQRRNIRINPPKKSGNGNRLIVIMLLVCGVVAILLATTFIVKTQKNDTNGAGLVLSGGGAKCAAQIGVLRVLEQEGVQISSVTGTSFGAVIGALYAAGYNADELENFFTSTNWLSCFASGVNIGSPETFIDGITTLLLGREQGSGEAPEGLSNAGVIESILASMLRAKGVETFSDLKIPFACVATDFDTMEQVVFTQGPIVKAIRASMAFPGLIKPVNDNGKILIDGGLLNNLPVDVARDMGARQTIAVDVQQQDGFSINLPIAATFSSTGIVAWVSSRPDIARHRQNINLADVYINPDTHGKRSFNFMRDDCMQMIRYGEETAKAKICSLRNYK